MRGENAGIGVLGQEHPRCRRSNAGGQAPGACQAVTEWKRRIATAGEKIPAHGLWRRGRGFDPASGGVLSLAKIPDRLLWRIVATCFAEQTNIQSRWRLGARLTEGADGLGRFRFHAFFAKGADGLGRLRFSTFLTKGADVLPGWFFDKGFAESADLFHG